jgi:hypothetical protein
LEKEQFPSRTLQTGGPDGTKGSGAAKITHQSLATIIAVIGARATDASHTAITAHPRISRKSTFAWCSHHAAIKHEVGEVFQGDELDLDFASDAAITAIATLAAIACLATWATHAPRAAVAAIATI